MIDTQNAREAKRQFPLAFLAGLAIVFVVVGIIALMSKSVHVVTPPPATPMAFGAPEQAYAAHIHYSGIQLAKSSNLLNQQFTYIAGTIANDGDRTIARLATTVTFYSDEKNTQVALRDTETVISEKDDPVPPGQHKDFQITLDQFPKAWNQQAPSISTTGLVLK